MSDEWQVQYDNPPLTAEELKDLQEFHPGFPRPKRKSRGFCSCSKLTPGTAGAPGDPEMGWVEKLLLWLFPHFDIIKTVPNIEDDTFTVLYLRRFYIWRSSWIGRNWGDLYLHKIYRSDDDPDPHDHPWNFRTFVLAGLYKDEGWQWTGPWDDYGSGRRERVPEWDEYLSAGMTRFRHRRHIHRVKLARDSTGADRPAWTLVFTSGYVHDANGNADWYFYTEYRKTPWREYLGLDDGIEHGG